MGIQTGNYSQSQHVNCLDFKICLSSQALQEQKGLYHQLILAFLVIQNAWTHKPYLEIPILENVFQLSNQLTALKQPGQIWLWTLDQTLVMEALRLIVRHMFLVNASSSNRQPPIIYFLGSIFNLRFALVICLKGIVQNRITFQSVDTLTEQLLDWIPRNTRKLKIVPLEIVAGVEQWNSNCFVLLSIATLSIFFTQMNLSAIILRFQVFWGNPSRSVNALA